MGQTADELTSQQHAHNSAKSADEESANTDEIRHDIEATRSKMSETIDALQDKLQPQHLIDEAKDSIREATIGKAEQMVYQARDTARGYGNSFIDTVRENPIPAALAGIGLGWLFMRGRSRTQQQPIDRRTYGYGDPRYADNGTRMTYYDERLNAGYRINTPNGASSRTPDPLSQQSSQDQGKLSQAGDKLHDLTSQAGDRLQDLGGQAQSSLQQVGGQAQYQAQQARGWFEQNLHENPLVVGAVALALGAVVGLVIPETEQEQQFMGDARDNLVDKAQGAAQDAMQKVQSVAQEAIDAAKEAAKDEAKHQGLSGNAATSNTTTTSQSTTAR